MAYTREEKAEALALMRTDVSAQRAARGRLEGVARYAELGSAGQRSRSICLPSISACSLKRRICDGEH